MCVHNQCLLKVPKKTAIKMATKSRPQRAKQSMWLHSCRLRRVPMVERNPIGYTAAAMAGNPTCGAINVLTLGRPSDDVCGSVEQLNWPPYPPRASKGESTKCGYITLSFARS